MRTRLATLVGAGSRVSRAKALGNVGSAARATAPFLLVLEVALAVFAGPWASFARSPASAGATGDDSKPSVETFSKSTAGHMGLRLPRDPGGRGEDDCVAVGIAKPELAVVRVRIAMNVEHDGRLEAARPRHGGVEVVDLEPEQHAIADRA
jgi:hypothetical protein